VENAVRHGRDGGRVSLIVAIGELRGEVTVAVEDDGPGIPPEQHERVFRRFHRLDAARATPGSGLGLALVRAVAELHGATIRLEDAAPGLRVTVRFRAPGERVAATP
jgi:signal transduction histidine kinase